MLFSSFFLVAKVKGVVVGLVVVVVFSEVVVVTGGLVVVLLVEIVPMCGVGVIFVSISGGQCSIGSVLMEDSVVLGVLVPKVRLNHRKPLWLFHGLGVGLGNIV